MIRIILSALNEAQNLQILLQNIIHECESLKQDYEIVICLDGGNDNSPEIIGAFKNCRILPIKNEKGLGVAFKRLFIDAIENASDNDYLISLDADNTHDPKQIKELVEKANTLKLDFIVASRFVKGSKMIGFPLHRQAISKSVSLILQTMLPIKKITSKNLQDYSSGYRLYRVKALKDLYRIKQNNFITEKDFVYTCELLLNLSRIKVRIDEIPLIYNYGKKIGVSKLNIQKNAKRLILLVARYIKYRFTKVGLV